MLETIFRVLDIIIKVTSLLVKIMNLHKDRRNTKDNRPSKE